MCFAVTEPNAGTNTFAIETLATKTLDGDYVLNGQKIFISAIDVSDTVMVVTRTTRASEVADRRQGLSLFVVDVRSPGIELQPLDIGIVMPDRQYSVFFTDVRVPADRLIGAEGEGFRLLFDALNCERLLAAAWAIGVGDYALDESGRIRPRTSAVRQAHRRVPSRAASARDGQGQARLGSAVDVHRVAFVRRRRAGWLSRQRGEADGFDGRSRSV